MTDAEIKQAEREVAASKARVRALRTWRNVIGALWVFGYVAIGSGFDSPPPPSTETVFHPLSHPWLAVALAAIGFVVWSVARHVIEDEA